MNTKLTNKGFTIIEVVLVLAIAGLIFLMVFVALPALQSGQRDTARKSDVSNVAAAVTSYANNNRGAFPTTAQLQTQLGMAGSGSTATFNGVSTNTTSISVRTATAGTAFTVPDATIYVVKGMKCNTVNANGSVTLASGTTRQFVSVTRLEGGNSTGYCLDS
jgi:type IV pilus assembly protein PilA